MCPPGTRRLSSSGVPSATMPAAVEHRDAVRELVRLVQVLGGEQHGGAVRDQAAHDVPHGVAAARVQARGGLVQEDDAGRRDEGHREVEAALHPARVGGERLAGGLDEVELLEQLGHPGLRALRSEVAQPGHQQEVLLAGEQLVDRGELAGEADRGADAVGVAHDVASVHECRAAVGPHQRGQDVHGRRLAGAVRAEQRGDGARAHGEVDVVEHDLFAVGLPQPADFDRWRVHVLRSLLLVARSHRARWMVMSPYWVRARTATVCSDASGARSPSSWLRTCPSFEDRSSQAGTPGRTPMVTWPKPLSTWMEPLETSAQLDAAVGGLRRDGGERLRDLEVAVGELRVEVAAGLPDQDGAVRRLEDRVAGDRADPDLTVVGRDLDPALGGAQGRVAVRGAQPQVAGGVEIHADPSSS